MHSPVISFVIITWNSGKYLEQCLDSLISGCKTESLDFEIIMIDNGSSDGSGAIFQRYCAAWPAKVEVIYLDSNRGTTYPRNLGLKKARGQHVCIFDSDAQLLDGSLREVLKALEGREEVGMIAPRLVLPDGTVQNSVKKFPAFWHKLLKLPGILLNLPQCNSDFYQGFPFPHQKEVDAAISACWFFKRELVDLIGYLDEKIFYSPEDLDYCLRVRKAGKKVLYFPNLTVLHHTQQISHNNPLSLLSISHFFGLLYYFRKHGGWLCSPSDWEVS